MKTGQEGRALIKGFEAWRAKAYQDSGGVWTIGWGHTAGAGDPKPKEGMVITEEYGEVVFKRDLEKFERAVWAFLRVEVNQNQFDALVSFCFNVGATNFKTSSPLKATNGKDWDKVPSRLALWNKVTNPKTGRLVISNGLVRRRKEEGELFMKPVEDNWIPDKPPQVQAISPRPVKPAHKSTTVWATLIKGVTGSAGAFFAFADTQPWLAGGMIAVTVVLAVWIIRERSKGHAPLRGLL